jgi:hypothetical protein
MVLHSEQRKRPGLRALSFFEQIGQAKTFGNRDTDSDEDPLRKKLMESSRLSLILKNWEKPKS